ncbi:MAG: hypothetical protein PHZ25_02670, partial [Candidatus Pacebacteria bacterium]|nr:hypothetical protein [Candidatus Paceibacterota bacterium]
MSEINNEELARIINKGFDGVQIQINGLEGRFDGLENRFDGLENRFDGLEKRMDSVDEKLEYIDARLGRLGNDVKELRGELVYRHEFEDALSRIKL